MKLSDWLKSESDGRVSVSRNVIILFAWSVPILATTSFLFGLMVGQITSTLSHGPSTVVRSNVRIELQRTSEELPSVVMLLPVNPKNFSRKDPHEILPASFKPLNNETIDAIHAAGGAISRTTSDGVCNLTVNANESFWLVILAPNFKSDVVLTKQESAGLSQYFLPLESLTRASGLHVESLRSVAGSQRVNVNLVQ